MGVVTSARAQAYNWTGLYAGMNLGGAWYHASTGVAATCPVNGYFCASTAGIANAGSIGGNASQSHSGSSFNGSADFGYEYQFKYFVFGAEGEVRVS